MTEDLCTISKATLASVTGGFDIGALAPIAYGIGGLVDSFTGGTQGQQIGGSVGAILQGVSGLIGSFGGGQQQQQQQGPMMDPQMGGPQMGGPMMGGLGGYG